MARVMLKYLIVSYILSMHSVSIKKTDEWQLYRINARNRLR